MTPAAFTAQANEAVKTTEAFRTGSSFRPARITRRPRLFNDYAPASLRLFHAWRA